MGRPHELFSGIVEWLLPFAASRFTSEEEFESMAGLTMGTFQKLVLENGLGRGSICCGVLADTLAYAITFPYLLYCLILYG
jgi:hypothetical protein